MFSVSSFAQKPINRIIVWDVTASMVGTTNNIPPAYGYIQDNDIDKSVRAGIIKIINETADDGGTFRIVPFRTSIIDDKKIFLNNSTGRTEAVNYITDYVIDKRPVGSTNICGAWDGAMGYIDPERQNIIYLFTDGNQNIPYGSSGINCLSDVVTRYCNVTAHSEIYTFFISLNIADNTFSQILNNACSSHLKYLSLENVKSKGVSLPTSLFAKIEPLIFNLQDSSAITVERFDCIGGELPSSFNMSAEINVGQQYALEVNCRTKSITDNKIYIEFSIADNIGGQIEKLKSDPHLDLKGTLRPVSMSNNISFASSEIKIKIINKKPQQLNFTFK